MKKIVIMLVMAVMMVSVAGISPAHADYTITTTAEQDAKVLEAATYAGYTNVDTFVTVRGIEEIEKTTEFIKQKRSEILGYLLYKNIDADDRATLKQIADKYK